jgi:hypothetical protein
VLKNVVDDEDTTAVAVGDESTEAIVVDRKG